MLLGHSMPNETVMSPAPSELAKFLVHEFLLKIMKMTLVPELVTNKMILTTLKLQSGTIFLTFLDNCYEVDTCINYY